MGQIKNIKLHIVTDIKQKKLDSKNISNYIANCAQVEMLE